MCGALKHRFLLLYGTQQGQAKAIAEEIGQQADDHGFIAETFSVKDLSKFSLENEKDPVVIVISTTGTGDPPDDAIKFVKKLKSKEVPADYFAHVRYGLLALGDSEYTYFCNGGKIVDKRLQELGAKHFYDTGYADDCVGLEIVVDPWVEGLWTALLREFMSRTKNQEMNGLIEAKNNNDSSVPGNLNLQIQNISLETVLTPSNTLLSSSCNEVEPSLVHSGPSLSLCVLNVPSIPHPFLDVHILDCEMKDPHTFLLYPEEVVFKVPIIQTKQLSAEDAVKTTLMVELDISHTDIDYQPGDSFCIICPNPPDEVTDLINKLGLSDKKYCQICLTVKSNTKKKGASVPDYIPEKCSLQFMLTWCLEIRTLPKKVLLRALVEYTSCATEKRRLLELCSKQGTSDYNHFIRDHAISILDILNAFPSCQPPLSLLIEHLPRLQARPYSAASSNLFYPGKLCFIFNIVKFPTCSERLVVRKGICTGWLANIVKETDEHTKLDTIPCSTDGINPVPQISLLRRPSTLFRLPSDTSAPIVMIGPGTGIAPFIGFLQHRQMLSQRTKHVFGDSWLFFGCRSHDKDYLFREELNCFIENSTLTHLKVCYSREAPTCTNEYFPKYVQESLKLCSKEIAKILTKENGYIYVCGDAKNMAKDVSDALNDILSTELCVDKLDAMKILASLRDQKRYVQDIWS